MTIVTPKILGMQVTPTSYAESTRQVIKWSKEVKSRYVCVSNVHMVMETYDSTEFRKVINDADIITPDGMPVVWVLRCLGYPLKDRVYGPTLTLHICEAAAREGICVGFYGGSSPEVLEILSQNLCQRFPGLQIAYAYSPPFRTLTPEEDEKIVQDIKDAGVQILFVGLGCPKQERWMAAHKGRIDAVMLGVGAAFDFHAGKVKQAPSWMQKRGLEWFFRLSVEPRRLWKRYVIHNPRFVWLVTLQLLGLRKFDYLSEVEHKKA